MIFANKTKLIDKIRNYEYGVIAEDYKYLEIINSHITHSKQIS